MAGIGSIRSDLIKNFEKYEGCVEHMYLDTVGVVTIGVGHALPSAQAAVSLGCPFYKWENGKLGDKATSKEIVSEWNKIKKQSKGMRAERYQYGMVISQSSITTLRDRDLAEFYAELKSFYSTSKGYKQAFDDMPDGVKLALFDMIFNLGQPKLKNFTKFNKAIAEGDWEAASGECDRKGVDPGRNSYVRKKLQSEAGSDELSMP